MRRRQRLQANQRCGCRCWLPIQTEISCLTWKLQTCGKTHESWRKFEKSCLSFGATCRNKKRPQETTILLPTSNPQRSHLNVLSKNTASRRGMNMDI